MLIRGGGRAFLFFLFIISVLLVISIFITGYLKDEQRLLTTGLEWHMVFVLLRGAHKG